MRGRFAPLYVAALASLNFAVYAVEPGSSKASSDDATAKRILERGRYMLAVGSCNDCHTAGFAPREGKVPESEWLLGSGPLGFSGPWGTTYPPNLRLTLSRMNESEWVKYAKTLKTRPPMPWFNLNRWKDADLRAFYQYVRSLGPAGEPAQTALPPGQAPKPPFILWPSEPQK